MSNKKGNEKNVQKKSNLPLILTAVVLVCVAVGAVTLKNIRGGSESGVTTVVEGGHLAIPTAKVTEDVSFYPLEVDGTAMEVLAVKASDGSIRTAFNTCQSCYTSGRGYYEQEGSELVCQNCGFHFTPDQVEIQSGGCNPWPIFAQNKTVTDDEIQIPYDFLKAATVIFDNWKA